MPALPAQHAAGALGVRLGAGAANRAALRSRGARSADGPADGAHTETFRRGCAARCHAAALCLPCNGADTGSSRLVWPSAGRQQLSPCLEAITLCPCPFALQSSPNGAVDAAVSAKEGAVGARQTLDRLLGATGAAVARLQDTQGTWSSESVHPSSKLRQLGPCLYSMGQCPAAPLPTQA